MATERPAPAEPSTRVADRYVIETELGAGGMGTVYRVHDEVTGRALALKWLHERHATEGAHVTALFKREYYTLKQLSHPLIVEVHDYGVHDGRPFFTMELLTGADLSACAPLPWREVCRVLRDVASALAMLHSRGLVHRDPSARNLRLDQSGHAKLFDFGALASRDVAQERVVGTPPYIAPEALDLLPLDARADLYALGALGYFLLTGRHAYPARRSSQLRDLWQSPPLPPSALGVESPDALDQLVLSLLSSDLRARPSHAGEVIDRLLAIADIEPLPASLTVRGYLNRPPLVGRDAEMAACRSSLRRALAGHGGALVLESAAGVGRTRLLEELFIEAKLLGATAAMTRAQRGAAPFETLVGLAERLVGELPESVLADAPRPSVPVVGESADGIGAQTDAIEAAQTRVVAWFCSLAERRPLFLAVDDLEFADQPSIAVLSDLAARAEGRRLMLVATLPTGDSSGTPNPRLGAFGRAPRIRLQPLGLAETTALYRHMFGDVTNLAELAAWADGVARGVVGDCVALAEDLVERGVIRYAEGVWLLPLDLEAEALPESLGEAFVRRIEGLSQAAREVAEVLGLAGDSASADDAVSFCSDRSESATFAALDELLEAEVLAPTATGYSFRQRALREVLEQRMGPARRRACHRQVGLAQLARPSCSLLQRVHTANHLLRGGLEERGLKLLFDQLATIENAGSPDGDLDRSAIAVFELALEVGERVGRPALEVLRLRLFLVICAFYFDHRLARYGSIVLDRLERDAGFDRLHEFEGESLAARAVQAIKAAGARYAQLPERERGFDPVRSAIELGRVLLVVQAVYGVRFDIDRTRACCVRFEPLAALSPLGALYHDTVRASVVQLEGRAEASLKLRRSMLERVEPEIAAGRAGVGLDALRMRMLQASMAYMVGLAVLFEQPEETLRQADTLDKAPGRHKAGAPQLRMLVSYLDGDHEAMLRWRAQYEERQVRFRIHASHGLDLSYLIQCFAIAEDLLALKAVVGDAQRLCAERPLLAPLMHVAQGHYARVRGEHGRALGEFDAALQLVPAGLHPAWAQAAVYAIQALCELGRLDEARSRLARASAESREHGVDGTFDVLALPATALLEALEGDCIAAAARLEAALERDVRMKAPRLVRGSRLALLLRVALIARDSAAFKRHAARLEGLCRESDSRLLRARSERLLELARAAGVIEHEPPDFALIAARAFAHAYGGMYSDANSLVETAPSFMDDVVHEPSGYLFGLRGGELHMVAAPRDRRVPPPAVVSGVVAELARSFGSEQASRLSAAPAALCLAEDGRAYRCVLLHTLRDGAPLVAGVAALEQDIRALDTEPSGQFVSALADELISAGETDALH